MKFKIVCFLLASFSVQFVNADSLEEIKINRFIEQFTIYQNKHAENIEILSNYLNAEDQSESETKFYWWTVCSTLNNLERSQKLMKDNPDIAQYLDVSVITSLEDNLDFYRYLVKNIEGTDIECDTRY